MDRKLFLSRWSVLATSLALLLALVLGGMQLSPFGVRSAQAATRMAATDTISIGAVPAAAIDSSNNHFVFWRGTDPGHGLWEGFYQASAAQWHGPINIPGMGPLGSEPTVTTSDASGAGGYDEQFVFWQGVDRGLWYAYWNGSWKGPIGLGRMGPLGSKPSATFDVYTQTLTVAWKGTDNNLWFAYSSVNVDGQPGPWSGPYGANWGPLGSPPSVADGGGGIVEAFWRGTDSYLWYGALQAGSYDPVAGPFQAKQSGLLGGDPSVSSADASDYQVFWSGRDNGLWRIGYGPNVQNPDEPGFVDSIPKELPNMGPLGSPPSCAFQWANSVYYCYWAGANAGYNLWEASDAPNGSADSVGGPTNLKMGPLQ